MYFADMHFEIFLADFAVFRVFWGISRKYLNFAGPRPRELSEALPKGYTHLYIVRNHRLQPSGPQRKLGFVVFGTRV